MDPAGLARLIFRDDDPTRGFTVRLWDGSTLASQGNAAASGTVVLTAPEAIALLLPPASERRLAEAFMTGLIEFDGDPIQLLESIALWRGPRPNLRLVAHALFTIVERAAMEAPLSLAASLRGRMHSTERDRTAVQHHYDVSDDFYALFLDPQMVYSCAYFPAGHEPLEEAQRAKLELVCRKLNLAADDRLLDVGCGWGAFLDHAARVHGASGVGVTLSAHQLEAARRRCAGRAEIRGADYRQLAGEQFDKIASIGMMEHVGVERLDEYFAIIFRLLRPGGLFLNHAIGDAAQARQSIPWVSRAGGGFIERYIFPDSELIPIGNVVTAAERAGFEVRDVESLREHYAQTLECWLRRLDGRFDEAVRLVGRERARMYRLYLASSAVAFRLGRISVYQLLLAKRTFNGRAEEVPRSRRAWTADETGDARGIAQAS